MQRKYIVCSECGHPFGVSMKRFVNQKRCAQCIAKGDKQIKSVPLSRKIIFNDIVTIGSLPGEWVKRPPKTNRADGYYQIDVSGKSLLDEWSDERPMGRIVINADREYKPGDKVRARVIRTVHQIKDSSTWETREYIALRQSAITNEMYPSHTLDWNVVEVDAGVRPTADDLIWSEWANADGDPYLARFVWGFGQAGCLSLTKIAQVAEEE